MKAQIIDFEAARTRLRPGSPTPQFDNGYWLSRVSDIDTEIRRQLDDMDRAERVRFPNLRDES